MKMTNQSSIEYLSDVPSLCALIMMLFSTYTNPREAAMVHGQLSSVKTLYYLQ